MATLNVVLESEGFQQDLNTTTASADRTATGIEQRFKRVATNIQAEINKLNKVIDIETIFKTSGSSSITNLQRQLEELTHTVSETIRKMSSVKIRVGSGVIDNSSEIASNIHKVVENAGKKLTTQTVHNKVVVKTQVVSAVPNTQAPLFNENTLQVKNLLDSITKSYEKGIAARNSGGDSSVQQKLKTALTKEQQTLLASMNSSLRNMGFQKSSLSETMLENLLKSGATIDVGKLEQLAKTTASKSKLSIDKHFAMLIAEHKKNIKLSMQQAKVAAGEIKFDKTIEDIFKSSTEYKAANKKNTNITSLNKNNAEMNVRIQEAVTSANAALKDSGVKGIFTKELLRRMLDSDVSISMSDIKANVGRTGAEFDRYIRSLIPEQERTIREVVKSKPKPKIQIAQKPDFFQTTIKGKEDTLFDENLQRMFTYRKKIINKMTPENEEALTEALHNQVKKSLDFANNALKSSGIEGKITEEVFRSMLTSNKKINFKDLAESGGSSDINSFLTEMITGNKNTIGKVTEGLSKQSVGHYERTIEEAKEVLSQFKKTKLALIAEARDKTLENDFPVIGKEGLVTETHISKGLLPKQFEKYKNRESEVLAHINVAAKDINETLKNSGMSGYATGEILRTLFNNKLDIPLSAFADSNLEHNITKLIQDKKLAASNIIAKQLHVAPTQAVATSGTKLNDLLRQARETQVELSALDTYIAQNKNMSSEEELDFSKQKKQTKDILGKLRSEMTSELKSDDGFGRQSLSEELFKKLLSTDQPIDFSSITDPKDKGTINQYIQHLLKKGITQQDSITLKDIKPATLTPEKHYEQVLNLAKQEYQKFISEFSNGLPQKQKNDMKKAAQTALNVYRSDLNKIAGDAGAKSNIAENFFERLLAGSFGFKEHVATGSALDSKTAIQAFKEKVNSSKIDENALSKSPLWNRSENIFLRKQKTGGLSADIFGFSVLNQVPFESITGKIKTLTSSILGYFKSAPEKMAETVILPFKALKQVATTPDLDRLKDLTDLVNDKKTKVASLGIDRKDDKNIYNSILKDADKYLDILKQIEHQKSLPMHTPEDFTARNKSLLHLKDQLLEINKLMNDPKITTFSEKLFGKNTIDLKPKAIAKEIDGLDPNSYENLLFKRLSWSATAEEKEKLNTMKSMIGAKEEAKMREKFLKDEDNNKSVNHNRQVARLNKLSELETNLSKTQILRSQTEKASGGPTGALYKEYTQMINKNIEIQQKLIGQKRNDPNNFMAQADAADILIGKTKRVGDEQHKQLDSIHKKQLQHQSQLAQWFETFGMTMSGIAATVFVGQYVFMAFKALADLKTVMQDKIESLGGSMAKVGNTGNFGAQQQEGTEKIIRAVASKSSVSIDQSLASLKKKLEDGETLSDALKNLVMNKMPREIESVANTIHSLTNMFKEIALTVFDNVAESSKAKMKELTEYLRANKEGIVEFIMKMVNGAAAILNAFTPILKVIGGILVGLGNIGDKLPTVTTAAIAFAATFLLSSKIPFFVAIESGLARLIPILATTGVALGGTFAGGFLKGFARKSIITAAIVGGTMLVAKGAEMLFDNAIEDKGKPDDWKKQLETKKLELQQLERIYENKKTISSEPLMGSSLFPQLAAGIEKNELEKLNKTKIKIEEKTKEIYDLQEKIRPSKTKATMVGYVDADTQIILINGEFERIRAAFINAEESVHQTKENSQKGKMASLFVQTWINPGDALVVTDYMDEQGKIIRDHYGRMVGKMAKEGDEVNTLQRILIKSGLAKYTEYQKKGEYNPAAAKVDEELKALKESPALVSLYHDMIEVEMNDVAKALKLNLDPENQSKALQVYFEKVFMNNFAKIGKEIDAFEEKMSKPFTYTIDKDTGSQQFGDKTAGSSTFGKDSITGFSFAYYKELDNVTSELQLRLLDLKKAAKISQTDLVNSIMSGDAKYAAYYDEAMTNYLEKREVMFKAQTGKGTNADQEMALMKSSAKTYATYMSKLEDINKDSQLKQLELTRQVEQMKMDAYEKTAQKYISTEMKRYSIALKHGSTETASIHAGNIKSKAIESRDMSIQLIRDIASSEYDTIYAETQKRIGELVNSISKNIPKGDALQLSEMMNSAATQFQEQNISSEMEVNNAKREIAVLQGMAKQEFGITNIDLQNEIGNIYKNQIGKMYKLGSSVELQIKAENEKVDDIDKGITTTTIEIQAKQIEKYMNLLKNRIEPINKILEGKLSTSEEDVTGAIAELKKLIPSQELLDALDMSLEKYNSLTDKAERMTPLFPIMEQLLTGKESLKNYTEGPDRSLEDKLKAYDDFIDKSRAKADTPDKQKITEHELAPVLKERSKSVNSELKSGVREMSTLLNDLSNLSGDAYSKLNAEMKKAGIEQFSFQKQIIEEEFQERENKIRNYYKAVADFTGDAYTAEQQRILATSALRLIQLEKEKEAKNQIILNDKDSTVGQGIQVGLYDLSKANTTYAKLGQQAITQLGQGIPNIVSSGFMAIFDQDMQNARDKIQKDLNIARSDLQVVQDDYMKAQTIVSDPLKMTTDPEGFKKATDELKGLSEKLIAAKNDVTQLEDEFNNAPTAFTTFLQGFKNLMDTILQTWIETLVKMQVEKMARSMEDSSSSGLGSILSLIGSGISAWFGGGSSPSSSYIDTGAAPDGMFYTQHTGGMFGESAAYVTNKAYLWDNAPRFHSGLLPNEYRAVLQKGEGVFTPEQMKALGSNNQTPTQPNVKIIINNNVSDQAEVKQDTRFDGQDMIVTLFIDAYQRNRGNIRDVIGR